MPSIDILLPARHAATLPLALGGIAGQNLTCFRLIVADQLTDRTDSDRTIESIRTVVQARCGTVDWHLVDADACQAEIFDKLLRLSTADTVLLLDDDVWLAPDTLSILSDTLDQEQAGFIGAQPVKIVPEQTNAVPDGEIEYWQGPVSPESMIPGDETWNRRASFPIERLYQVGQQIDPGQRRIMKVAWIDKCCLYDRHKLLKVGGFQFWHRLPRDHQGAQLIPQTLIMRRWGGGAIVPTGAYHIDGGPDAQSLPSESVVALLNRAIDVEDEPNPMLTAAPGG